MNMRAKEKCLFAIEQLLQIKSIEKISVTEIVTKAGVCRKTFYRNFQDKYDLVSCYFYQFFDKTFGQIICGEDFDTALVRYLSICEQRSVILKNAYTSMDINNLRNYDIELTRKTYEKYLLAQGANIETKEMKFAIEIAVRGGTDMVIEWLMSGMKEDKISFKNLIKRTLPNDLLQYLK